MATFSSVTRQHVLQALAEYDARGGGQFLDVYGFEPSHDHTLVHEGRRYDLRAVLGVAHRYATGRLATQDDFGGGMQVPVAISRRRGFEVIEPAPLVRRAVARAGAPRAVRSPAIRTVARADTPQPICPTCSMVLPSTGVCDYCG